MKLSIILKNYWKYLSWFVMLMTLAVIISYYNYENTKKSYDDNKFAELTTKLKETLDDFNLRSDFVFQIFQSNPKIFALLENINSKDTIATNKIKKSIQEIINQQEFKFQQLGIFKFSLIRKDKSVFARFFEPFASEDDLSFRQLLNKAEETQYPQSDFSSSTYDYSYRRIYPIIKNNNILCFLEIGLSEEFLSKSFSFDNSRITEIHYFFDDANSQLPKNLIPSPINKRFFVNKNNNLNYSDKTNNLYASLITLIHKHSYITNKMSSKTRFNHHFDGLNKMYSVYFLPIVDSNNNFCGYLIHGFNNITLENKLSDTIIINIAAAAFLVILLFVLAYRKHNIDKLEQNILELQKEKKRSHRLIEQLNKSQNELKEKADFVTIINNVLHEQEQLLRKNLDEKNRFFSILAHDIKNPISSLYTTSELLTLYYDQMDDNEKKELANRLLSSSKSLDKLVKDLLEWGKLQLGQYSIELKEISLKQEIDKIFDTYAENARSKDINFVNLISNDITITSDIHIIRTIFRNLVQNSIKFTEKGKITIKAEEFIANKIRIVFTDTGVGIPQDKIKDLFKVDKAFSTKGTRDEEGSGLGLILVNDYISKIEGTIEVESNIGKGTTFYITLPYLS